MSIAAPRSIIEGMDNRPVAVHVQVGAGNPYVPAPLMGVSAELAQAAAQLRRVTPAGQWDAVFAEVRREQAGRKVSRLEAMRLVHAKLTSGWTPGGWRA